MKYKTEIQVRYQETDQMGIVHHSVYAIWYEIGRTKATEQMGYDYNDIETRGLMMPVVNLRSDFIGTAKYNDLLTIVTCVTSLAGARVVYNYEIYNSGGTLINKGSTTQGFVDSKTFRPVNVKKKFPDIYNALSDAMEHEQL